MLRGIIFDMDGVLVDNAEFHVRAFEMFQQRYGVGKPFTTDLFGRTNKAILEILMPETVAEKGWHTLSQEKEEVYRNEFREQLKPVEGLLDLLAACKAEGIKCAIGSSACKENVEFIIDLFGLEDYIDAWCCEDDVTLGKPDPEVYLKSIAKLGLTPADCVVFEDATAGITAGNRAGCKVVALTTSNPRELLEKTEADMIIDDFRDISIERLRKLVG